MSMYKIVQLTCGLGNQMFQYAFAKSLQKHLQCEVLLDKTWFEVKYEKEQFCLDIFNVDLDYATNEQILFAKARVTKLPGFLRKIFGLKKYRISYSQAFDFHEEYLLANDFMFFSGFFQNPKYFKDKDIDFLLRKTFAYETQHFSDYAKERLDKILQTKNSVFVHVRRGDYCKLGWELGVSYYKKAVKYILERVENPTFFLFGATDSAFMDVFTKQFSDFGCEFLNFGEKIITVKNQHEDMFLMRYCNHAIVANSSYSFWSAYLNDKKDKIVVAPTPWLLGRDDIICEDWIKINIGDGK